MKEELTPKQVAMAIGVSEASIKRWCDRGTLPASRTAGGHRRVQHRVVIQFLRSTGHPIVRPELLGLPIGSGRSEAAQQRVSVQFQVALERGEHVRCRQIILNQYLAQRSVVEICDQIITPAFRSIGHHWEHGTAEIYQERRACEIGVRILHELGKLLPEPAANAPDALGGTLAGDHYMLPTMMVELVLREMGMCADSYGCNQPATTLATAITDRAPRLFWLSVSHIESLSAFESGLEMLHATAAKGGTALVVGGRALVESVRNDIRYTAYCDNLIHLSDFMRTFQPKDRRG